MSSPHPLTLRVCSGWGANHPKMEWANVNVDKNVTETLFLHQGDAAECRNTSELTSPEMSQPTANSRASGGRHERPTRVARGPLSEQEDESVTVHIKNSFVVLRCEVVRQSSVATLWSWWSLVSSGFWGNYSSSSSLNVDRVGNRLFPPVDTTLNT